MILTNDNDPTGYRRIYERLVKVIPPASRPTKEELALAILSEPKLYSAKTAKAAREWRGHRRRHAG